MSSDEDFELERMVEAVLFAATEPVSIHELKRLLPPNVDVNAALQRLHSSYANRGVRLEKVGDLWAFRTASDLSYLMQPVVSEHRKLSRAGLEVLAIIAYHQPVTRVEIETIRGVSVSSGTIDMLIERGWVGFGKRRESPGRPATFVTTPIFLDYFGLGSVGDLPGLEELRQSGFMEKMAPTATVLDNEQLSLAEKDEDWGDQLL